MKSLRFDLFLLGSDPNQINLHEKSLRNQIYLTSSSSWLGNKGQGATIPGGSLARRALHSKPYWRATPRAQAAWLLGHILDLGEGQPRGEGVDSVRDVPVVGVQEAWLAGVAKHGARQERLVPTAVRIFVHGVGVWWLPEDDEVGFVSNMGLAVVLPSACCTWWRCSREEEEDGHDSRRRR